MLFVHAVYTQVTCIHTLATRCTSLSMYSVRTCVVDMLCWLNEVLAASEEAHTSVYIQALLCVVHYYVGTNRINLSMQALYYTLVS